MGRGWGPEKPIEDIKVKELGALISYKMDQLGFDNEIVSAKIQMKKDTFRKKRRHPETFKYIEVIRLTKVLKFSDEELLKVV